MINNLKAYRFSQTDFIQILSLKTTFEDNGYKVDLFPEVYYDKFDNYVKLYGEPIPVQSIAREELNTQDIYKHPIAAVHEVGSHIVVTHDVTPDYLAVYHFFNESSTLITKEGIIVLFKDRIEDFCKRNLLTEKDVCHVVLMHELGHWFCHWPSFDSKNWSSGFGLENINTHESLAQFMAWWCVEGNLELEKILCDNLTPKGPTNSYALYQNLKGIDKTEILKKLVELRQNYFLSDNHLYQFLENRIHLKLMDFIFKLFEIEKELSEQFLYLTHEPIKSNKDWRVFKKEFYTMVINGIEKNIGHPNHQAFSLDIKHLLLWWKSDITLKVFLDKYKGAIKSGIFGL